ncbi:carbon storage regulator [Lentibacillus sp. N15]|uniref:carbon storage regulator n=1 Tax=Lentibacillus songyuanensis TaxID=3136161 RepID=UPI0031BAF00D
MALTLGRRPGENVFIIDERGREIEVEVMKDKSSSIKNALKLRITAPREFKVVRGEIYDGNNS